MHDKKGRRKSTMPFTQRSKVTARHKKHMQKSEIRSLSMEPTKGTLFKETLHETQLPGPPTSPGLSPHTATPSSPKTTAPHKGVVGALVALLFAALIIGSVFLVKALVLGKHDDTVIEPRYVSPVEMGSFKNWIAVTGAKLCDHVPKKIFAKNGTVGDAAVATMLCICVVMPHRCGLGGGFFATYYNRRQRTAHAISCRGQAPKESRRDMFSGKKDELLSLYGGKAVAVFGVLRGFGMILNTTGHNLPWKDLFQDAIKYAREGFPVYDEIHNYIEGLKVQINQNTILKKALFKKNCPSSLVACPLAIGDIMKNKVLADTLTNISLLNSEALNSPPYSKILAEDIRKEAGIITASDLENFQPILDPPLIVKLAGGFRLYTLPLPSGGTITSYITNIINQFVVDGQLPDDERTAHIFIEAFKFGFATREHLGDPRSSDFEGEKRRRLFELMQTLTSNTYAARIKAKIKEQTVADTGYYGLNFTGKDGHGSGQLVIVAPNGDAISMVASINTEFGALVLSRRTGIWMNNVMDDFSQAAQSDIYDFVPTSGNYILEGKRPLSSLAPSIVVDSSGDFVIGITSTGSGTIITGIVQVLARILWMRNTVKEAIDCFRIHTQLKPDIVKYENTTDKSVVSGLQRRKHNVTLYKWDGNVIAVVRDRQLKVYNGSSDYRTAQTGGVTGG
ncbi:scoloptoxin SSD14-like [Ornithodoros turicata]|uniref:scoloptoxin SSD14-like n=1 Tax=Ornithodoros turicata TaxID=34597 RepID=UPI003138B281